MKKAYVFLATGFEEVEAIGTIDVLRRGGMHVVTVSMTGAATVKGGHDIPTGGRPERGDAAPREGRRHRGPRGLRVRYQPGLQGHRRGRIRSADQYFSE